MKVEGENPTNGQKMKLEGNGICNDFIKFLNDFEMSEEGIKRLIDNLDISADAKSLLFSFSKSTIKVGDYVIKIGRKIVDFVCTVYEQYPSTTFGVVFGAIAGFLISSIPILGFVLGPIFGPIAIAMGLVMGYFEDIKDNSLKRKIEEINAKFEPLGAN